MRRFFSAAAALVMMLIFIPSFSIKASAAKNYAQGWDGDPGKSGLIDNADLFEDWQEEELSDAIRAYSEELKINIMVYVAGSGEYRDDYSTEIFSDDYYDELFGEDTDGVFFYMDFTGKSPAYDVLSTSGEAALKFGGHIDRILANVHKFFPPSSVSNYSDYADTIASGVICFLGELESYNKSYRKASLDYYYDQYSHKYFYYKFGKLYITKSKPPIIKIQAFLIASIVGSLVAVIVYFTTKSTYRFKSATNARIYASSEQMERFGWQDQFIRSYQTKTRIESNSGGGGSRSHSGGGHSHSGGHRTGGRHR